MEAEGNDVSVKVELDEGPDGQIKLALSPSQQMEAVSLAETPHELQDVAAESDPGLPSSAAVRPDLEVTAKEAPEPAQFSSVPLEPQEEPSDQTSAENTDDTQPQAPSSQAQETVPKLPPLPSPFFPESGSPSTAVAPGAAPGTPTHQNSTPRGIPVSQNGTAAAAAAAAANGFSPPSSPHPLDNPRPPTFLQVDVSYRDLLFTDGYDSHGRPVIVLNTSALPHKSRKDEVLEYLKQQLAPIVQQGPYVLVLVACSDGPKYKALPSLWTLAAYRSLARPFRKNVKFIVMVNPSLLVRAALVVLKPVISKKAFAKLKQVKVLSDMDQSTNGEVRLEHTGPRFMAFLQQRSAS